MPRTLPTPTRADDLVCAPPSRRKAHISLERPSVELETLTVYSWSEMIASVMNDRLSRSAADSRLPAQPLQDLEDALDGRALPLVLGLLAQDLRILARALDPA